MCSSVYNSYVMMSMLLDLKNYFGQHKRDLLFLVAVDILHLLA